MREAPDISMFSADDVAASFQDLANLLHACVHDGASIGFVLPFSIGDAEAFWAARVLPRIGSGALMLLAARFDGRVVGTVQLDCDTPPNQPHRAEVRKLLVQPSLRRQGIARALMVELARHAACLGRSLLTLDTRTGDAAESLYASMGFEIAGIIPGYCRDSFNGRLDPTTVMYKNLELPGGTRAV